MGQIGPSQRADAMFLEFSVANFRSFKDRATLSMEATTDDWLEETHIANVGGRRLARTVAVYGANAGGKSNLLLAMSTFREFLKNSSKNTQLGDRIPVIPFRLHTETERAPSHFEVVFVIDGTRYRYGFEATTEAVTSEWLFSQADSIRETTLFTREDNRIEVSDAFREGRSFEKFTRQNALFLSVVAQFNGETAGKIMGWMLRFNGISGISDQATLEFTVNLMSNSEYAPLILNLIRQADVGIESLKRMEVSPDQVVATLPKGIPDGIRELFLQSASRGAYSIRTLHRRFDSTGNASDTVEFDFQAEESAGTQKLVAMAGPFLHTLREGSVLFVDELEARLHPLLTKALVGLFNSPANTKNAQLIYATHDEGLLDSKRTRRDQVWFVEKDPFSASRLYCLDEFKGVRKEAKFAKEYLLGQFGGVPRLGDLEEVIHHGR
jgi:AAA15 family ATPase/GTPase